MPLCPVTILGGLPVLAEVWFTVDYYGESDSGVDAIYWQKRDGTKGKEVSQKIYDRLEKDAYWQASVTEQAVDWLAYADHQDEERITLS